MAPPARAAVSHLGDGPKGTVVIHTKGRKLLRSQRTIPYFTGRKSGSLLTTKWEVSPLKRGWGRWVGLAKASFK